MANLRKKDEDLLVWIENIMFVILNQRPDIFTSDEAWLDFWEKYTDLWKLNERLITERKQTNEISKEKMRKFRNNPETRDRAKAYAREYMREYNKRKKNS